MPAEFNRRGLGFQYPENWQLDCEESPEESQGRQSVTVYSPGGAFWSVSVDPAGSDPARLAQAAVKAMQEEYSEVEVSPASDTVAGVAMAGFDLNFYYLDLTSTAVVRCFQTEQATYTIFYQSEDRELQAIEKVFLAMTTSMIRHLAGSGRP
jgi:hypothetical protein